MRFVRRTFVAAIFVVGALICTNRTANAHAISIGFENAGVGAVNVWMGTYQHSGHHLEGSMRLTGVLGTVFGPSTLAFNMLTPDGAANKPAGLVDGVTNFYASGTLNGGGPLVNSNPFTGTVTALNPSGFLLPVNHWQGVTFSGLSAGDYNFTFIPIANPSAEWTPFTANMNSNFTLSGQIVGGPTTVPEPATLTLFGFALLGLAGMSRKRHGIKR